MSKKVLIPIDDGAPDEYHCRHGADFTDACNHAKQILQKNRSITVVRFKFSGVLVLIEVETPLEALDRDLLRSYEGSIPKEIGPNPALSLSEAMLEHDDRVRRWRRIVEIATGASEAIQEAANELRVPS